MAKRMPPPGTSGTPGKGVAIMIGIPHDPHDPNDPNDAGSRMPGRMPGRMSPPGLDAGSGKASPDEACVVREDAHCIDCENYSVDDGSCSKVEGQFSPQDACAKYFEPVNDNESDEGEPSTGGDDDQGGGTSGATGGGTSGGGMT
jgi:hypothetical protein